MLLFSLVLHLLLLNFSVAASTSNPTLSSTSTAPTLVSTACGDIVNSCDTVLFNATQAYDCLISVPFNPAVATRFVKYYNEGIQFQSTLAYLKDPPTSYQQPAVDFLQGLERIQRDIDDGLFLNQYAFEATLQNLIYSAHDTHVNLVAGILGVFTFASPLGIVSASIDGIQIPKVYVTDDLQGFNGNWRPSAISSINGQNVTDYLTQFAAVNALGNLEPNADWNALMSSSANDIQNSFGIFEGYVTFYPGDTIDFGFENGTSTGLLPWLAVYNSPGDTGPLTTGGDFYNFFVLNLYPASYDPSSPTNCGSAPTAAATSSISSGASSISAIPEATSTPIGWGDGFAYPATADVAQSDLGNTGFITGYFLQDISTAVISIPTFASFDQNATQAFSAAVGQFLQSSKTAGMNKVVIDLQQNTGGNPLLAFDAFKQFFPTVDPFGGSRLRAQPKADILGNTFTNYYSPALNETFYDALSASDWVATDRINANTNQNFTSWGEFFGPHLYNGDNFTTTQRENLSSNIFDEVASGGIVVYGFADRPANTSQPYASQDIVILTDGLCASACALFMEMMHHEAGVQTVVVGGRPNYGPMQAPAGTRGAQDYTFSPYDGDLDTDIAFANSINATSAASFPDQSEDVLITFASLNLRDQIRRNETIPLQFVYEAANCRIYYTLLNAYNYTALWHSAAAAIWSTPSLCVSGSTGYATNGSTSDTTGPPAAVKPPIAQDMSAIIALAGISPSTNVAGFSGPQSDGARSTVSAVGQPCGGVNKAPACIGGQTTCSSTTVSTCGKSYLQCVRPCSSLNPYVCGTGGCRYYGPKFESKQSVKGHTILVKFGYCPVSVSCSSNAGLVGPNGPPLPPQSDEGVEHGGEEEGEGESLGRWIQAGMGSV
ncbi:hypothetical protein MMC13_001826 [Lambiella insularis]|nr:hypothetical protein [Lambiella insularis]